MRSPLGTEGDQFHKPPSGGFGVIALAALFPDAPSESPINGAQNSCHFTNPGVNAWAREKASTIGFDDTA